MSHAKAMPLILIIDDEPELEVPTRDLEFEGYSSQAERASLVAGGWTDEGVKFYAGAPQ